MAKLLSTGVRFLAVASVTALSACSQGAAKDSPSDNPSGQVVYAMPLRDGNSFACATCHALSEPSADALRRPAHPIGDATRRSQWKNGKAATFLDAVNSCVTEWMVAPAWQASDPRFVALRSFLDSQAPSGAAPDLSYEIVAPPADVTGGDVERGRSTFNQSCVVCHGTDGLGSIRGPKIAGSTRRPEYIAGRIRMSGSPRSAVYSGLTGGVMPFWAKDRLSDDDVRDLVAFIAAPAQPTSSGTGGGDKNDGSGGSGTSDGSGGSGGTNDGTGGSGGTNDGSGGGGGSDCGRTNPRVGWTADLGVNTGEGQVSGFVTMVDDCTLELHDFSYDGNGIDVRVYGSKDSSFRPAFTMGPNLVGRTFSKETWRVTLPADKTLADLDWVGIWCVAVGADFGSGPFKAP
jgi:mono/diheme cytochrome c family protein